MKMIREQIKAERGRDRLKYGKRQRDRKTDRERPIKREQILRQKETETEKQRQKDGKLQTVESAIRNSGLNVFVIAMTSEGNYCNDKNNTQTNKGRERKREIEIWKKTKRQKDRQTKKEITDTEKERQTERQKNRKTEKHTHR